VSGEGTGGSSVSSGSLAARLISLAFCCCALVLAFIGFFKWDVPLTRFVRSLNDYRADHLHNPWLAQLSDVGDRLGRGESLVLLSLILLAVGFVLKHPVWKAAGWDTLLAHGIVGLINNVLKHLIGRARPKFMHTRTIELSPVSGSGWDSFPSGHAMASFAIATVLAAKWPKARWGILLLAFAIAASRIVRGSHFLTDVVGGALLGYLIGSFVAHPWRDWRSSLESALFAFTPVLAALLAIVWTIGHRPSDLWPGPPLAAAGATLVSIAVVGHVLLVVQAGFRPAFLTRSLSRSLTGLGLGMVTGSAWVATTVLLVCAAYWFRRSPGEEAERFSEQQAGSITLLKETAFVLLVLSALWASFELRGALPML
jgi:membrane-associated phospholipid phosphatase